jgi:hypothetical protein
MIYDNAHTGFLVAEVHDRMPVPFSQEMILSLGQTGCEPGIVEARPRTICSSAAGVQAGE